MSGRWSSLVSIFQAQVHCYISLGFISHLTKFLTIHPVHGTTVKELQCVLSYWPTWLKTCNNSWEKDGEPDWAHRPPLQVEPLWLNVDERPYNCPIMGVSFVFPSGVYFRPTVTGQGNSESSQCHAPSPRASRAQSSCRMKQGWNEDRSAHGPGPLRRASPAAWFRSDTISHGAVPPQGLQARNALCWPSLLGQVSSVWAWENWVQHFFMIQSPLGGWAQALGFCLV